MRLDLLTAPPVSVADSTVAPSTRRRRTQRAGSLARVLLRAPDLVLWAMVLLLMPIYVWQSGRPQPADLLSIAFLPFIARKPRPALPPFLKHVLVALVAFAVYAALVNLAWGVLLLNYDVRKVGAVGFASFYLFNAYVFGICIYLFLKYRSRFVVVTVWATVAALALQVLGYAVRGPASGFRESLMFNNANQLGYYALLSATLIAFGYRKGRLPVWLAGGAVSMCVLLAALSLSKAAMLGSVAVAAVAAFRRPVLLAAVAVVLLVAARLGDPTALIERVEMRMNDFGRSYDDTPQGRGYSRIEQNPQYLVLGAGEVGHDRHNRDIAGELHSSVGTLIFSYGAVGTILFCVFLWRALRLVPFSDLVFFLPIFAYGLTHQGIRFRLFWILLAVACALGVEAQVARSHRRRQAHPGPVVLG